MSLIDCLGKSKYFKPTEITALAKKSEAYQKNGMSKIEADKKVIAEEIKSVHDNMRSVYSQLGVEFPNMETPTTDHGQQVEVKNPTEDVQNPVQESVQNPVQDVQENIQVQPIVSKGVGNAGRELKVQSGKVEDILGLSGEDADALSIIHNADLTPTEKQILWRQYKRGVMNLNDVKNHSGIIDLEKLNSEDIGKWARAALEKQKSKGGKFNAEDIDFEELPTEQSLKEQSKPNTTALEGVGGDVKSKLENEGFKPTLKPNGANEFILQVDDTKPNGKRSVGVIGLKTIEIGGKKLLSIGMTNVREGYEGKGLATNMYRYLMENLPEGYDGILSPKETRWNNEQIPKIHEKLSKEYDKTELNNGDIVFKNKAVEQSLKEQPTPASEGVDRPEVERTPKNRTLLDRAANSKAPEQVKAAIKAFGLDREVVSNEEAEKAAQGFIDYAGVDNALNAVRDGSIKGSYASYVWAKAIDAVGAEFENASPELQDQLAGLQASLLNEFDLMIGDASRSLQALTNIYKVSPLGYAKYIEKKVDRTNAANMARFKNQIDKLKKKVDDLLKENADQLTSLKSLEDKLNQNPKAQRKQELADKFKNRFRAMNLLAGSLFLQSQDPGNPAQTYPAQYFDIKSTDTIQDVFKKLSQHDSDLKPILEHLMKQNHGDLGFILYTPGENELIDDFIAAQREGNPNYYISGLYFDSNFGFATPLAQLANKIVINTENSTNFYYDFLHETMHWHTLENIGQLQNFIGEKAQKNLEALYKYIDAFKGVENTRYDAATYGMQSYKEFLAEICINPYFRKHLSDLIIRNKEEFQQVTGIQLNPKLDFIAEFSAAFIKFIKKLFGINDNPNVDTKESVLDNAIRLMEQVYFGGQNVTSKITASGEFAPLPDIQMEGAYAMASNQNKIKAFHGSTQDFSKFDPNKFGRGVGKSKLGWGVNVTQSKNSAWGYASMAEGWSGKNQVVYDVELVKKGPFRWFDMIKPLTEKQKKEIKDNWPKSKEGLIYSYLEGNGEDVYDNLKLYFHNAEGVSKFLHSLGYDGTMAPDKNLRVPTPSSLFDSNEKITGNSYAVFDPKIVKIKNSAHAHQSNGLLDDKEFMEYARLVAENKTLEDFSREMIENVGEGVQPFLQEVYDEVSKPTAGRPRNETNLDAYFGKGKTGSELLKLAREYYLATEAEKIPLREWISQKTGIPVEELTEATHQIEKDFDEKLNQKILSEIDKTFKTKTTEKNREKKNKIVEAINLGLKTNVRKDGSPFDFEQEFFDLLGFVNPKDPDVRKKLNDFAERIYKNRDARNPIFQHMVEIELEDYLANKSKESRLVAGLTSQMYANMLYGQDTHIRNTVFNIQKALLSAVIMSARNPKQAGNLLKAFGVNFDRGVKEAVSIIKTGNHKSGTIEGRPNARAFVERAVDLGFWSSIWSRYARVPGRFLSALDAALSMPLRGSRAALLVTEAYQKEHPNESREEVAKAVDLLLFGNQNEQQEWRDYSEKQIQKFYKIDKPLFIDGERNPEFKDKKYNNMYRDYKRSFYNLREQKQSLEVQDESKKFADAELLMGTPRGTFGAVARVIGSLGDFFPLLKVTNFPFINVPFNMAAHFFEMTPFGYINVLANREGLGIPQEALKRHKIEFELSEQRRKDLAWKASIGTIGMAAAYALTKVTYYDDEEKKERPLLIVMADGAGNWQDNQKLEGLSGSDKFQEYTIDWMGHRMSYKSSPFAPMFLVAGYLMDYERYGKKDNVVQALEMQEQGLTESQIRSNFIDKEGIEARKVQAIIDEANDANWFNDPRATRFKKSVGGYLSFMKDQSSISGFADFVGLSSSAKDDKGKTDWVRNAKKSGANIIRSLVLPNFIPQSYRHYKSITDGLDSRAIDFDDYLMKDIPFVDDYVSKSYDHFGNPINSKAKIPGFWNERGQDCPEYELMKDKEYLSNVKRFYQSKITLDRKDVYLNADQIQKIDFERAKWIGEFVRTHIDDLKKLDNQEFRKRMNNIQNVRALDAALDKLGIK